MEYNTETDFTRKLVTLEKGYFQQLDEWKYIVTKEIMDTMCRHLKVQFIMTLTYSQNVLP